MLSFASMKIGFLLIIIGFVNVCLAKEYQYCQRMHLIDQAKRIDLKKQKLTPDKILISKSRKKLYLLNQGRVLQEYSVSFGFGYADGSKIQKGDGRTPEGSYKVSFKNEESAYRKALRISYPNSEDLKNSQALGVDPGGDIMIHGFPNKDIEDLKLSYVQQNHLKANWTQGCIAVTNKEIDQIFSLVNEETVVEICPLES